MMDVARTVGMFNAWIQQANARVRREIRWAEAEERRALIAEAAKEGKTLEQKIVADLQKKRKQLEEEMSELTMTIEEASLRYTKGKQGLRRRMETLRTQMDKAEIQINENNGSIQTLLYGGSRVEKEEEGSEIENGQ